MVAAVKNWLHTATGWLLILDNADDLALARDFLPPSEGLYADHLRAPRPQAALPAAWKLKPYRLNRAHCSCCAAQVLLAPDAPLETASPSDVTVAKKITEELGGLPLAP